jgi:hypothetical protein
VPSISEATVKVSRTAKLALFAVAVFTGGALASPQLAAAKKKKPKAGATKPACDQRFLPLVAGNSWTYQSGADQVTVKITSVGPGEAKGSMLIKVEETFGALVSKNEWTCDAKGLRVSPDSFFFAGEPGGVYGTQVTWTSHDDVWLHPDVEVVPESGWQEKLKADVTRTDLGGTGLAHPPAKLEVERYVIVHPAEAVQGNIFQGDALKVEFQLRARAFIGEEKVELQIIDDKNPGAMWMVKDFGVVKVKDNLKGGKTWDLINSSVELP